MSRRLNEIKANLEELNIFINTTQDSKTRLGTIVICKIPFEALEASETPDSRPKQADSSNATANAPEPDHQIASDKGGQSLMLKIRIRTLRMLRTLGCSHGQL